MMSKKDMLTLGVLAIGGVAIASSFAGGDGVLQPVKERVGGIVGSQRGYDAAPTIYNLPPAAPVTFPKAPTFDLSAFLAPKEPINKGAQGVSSAGKKEVIYGGYKPSGESYVFGGKAFETQAVKEIVSGGYSPTLGAAFGISPEIVSVSKKTTPKKEPVTTTTKRYGPSTRTTVSRVYGVTTGGGVR